MQHGHTDKQAGVVVQTNKYNARNWRWVKTNQIKKKKEVFWVPMNIDFRCLKFSVPCCRQAHGFITHFIWLKENGYISWNVLVQCTDICNYRIYNYWLGASMKIKRTVLNYTNDCNYGFYVVFRINFVIFFCGRNWCIDLYLIFENICKWGAVAISNIFLTFDWFYSSRK